MKPVINPVGQRCINCRVAVKIVRGAVVIPHTPGCPEYRGGVRRG